MQVIFTETIMKSSFSQHPILFVIINIAIAAIIVGIVLVITHFTLLNATHHGEEIEVPDVSGMFVDEAQIVLDANQLSFQVIDSTYDRSKPLGTVLQQVPIPGSHVKKHREIYLSINAKQIRKVKMPDLHDISYREAKVRLEATGLHVDTTYEASEFKDLVLDVKYKQQSIQPDTWIKEGETITLIIGKGKDGKQDDFNAVVPNLIGLPLNIARSTIASNCLQLGGCLSDDGKLDTLENTYWVYDQDPLPRVATYVGATISIYVSTDPEKAEQLKIERQKQQENKAAEEEFF